MDLLSKGKKLLLSVSRDTLLVLMNCKGSTAVRKKGEAQQCPPQPLVGSGGRSDLFRGQNLASNHCNALPSGLLLSPVNLAAQPPTSLQPANTAQEVTATMLHKSPARMLTHTVSKYKRALYSSECKGCNQRNHKFQCNTILTHALLPGFSFSMSIFGSVQI